MPVSDKDPYTLAEMAAIVRIGVQIQHRQAAGKSTAALEAKAERIQELAIEREQLRADKAERERRQKAVRKYG